MKLQDAAKQTQELFSGPQVRGHALINITTGLVELGALLAISKKTGLSFKKTFAIACITNFVHVLPKVTTEVYNEYSKNTGR